MGRLYNLYEVQCQDRNPSVGSESESASESEGEGACSFQRNTNLLRTAHCEDTAAISGLEAEVGHVSLVNVSTIRPEID